MTRAQYQRELEALEREADMHGCCVIPAQPIPPPDGVPEKPGEAGA